MQVNSFFEKEIKRLGPNKIVHAYPDGTVYFAPGTDTLDSTCRRRSNTSHTTSRNYQSLSRDKCTNFALCTRNLRIAAWNAHGTDGRPVKSWMT
jgi:hypothetical protein